MDNIISIKGREILDSRGDPTVEVELETQNHIKVIASVPSGASVGSYEMIELRDNDQERFAGMGVLKAIENIKNTIAPAVIGQDVENQKAIDDTMIQLDGTPHKSNLGANAILAVSIATAKAGAMAKDIPLYRYIAQLAENPTPKLPLVMFNFIEGAKHADNNLQIQEFLVIPEKGSFAENYRNASELFHKLRKILKDRNLGVAVGHEGGFAPSLPSDEDALQLIQEAGKIRMALDLAGVVPNGMNLEELIMKYPIVSLEDPIGEDDWEGFINLTSKIKDRCLVVGDDLLATNKERLAESIEKNAVTGVIVKPNQVGTITEAIAFTKQAKTAGLRTIISHRSGETEDTFIADFAVGVGADFAKLGAPSRGERVSKYNRLLRIEEEITNGTS